jgi:DnaJ-class molecular chaperone
VQLNQSLYEILGISKDADADEIKRAYRKMVQLYHPDKAGDTPENTERFAQICKAYEILSDPEKRALYDRPRRQRTFYRSSWRPPRGANFSAEQPSTEPRPSVRSSSRNPSWKQPSNNMSLDDLFGQSDVPPSHSEPRMRMSGRYAQNQAQSGPREDGEDIHVEVEVPQRTAVRGGMVQFEYRRNRRTDGLEVQSVLELFYLRVPAGTRDGEVLDIEKMGHSGVNGGRSGDLHCTVRLIGDEQPSTETSHASTSQNSTFTESSEHLSNTLSVSIAEAVLGGRVDVQTPQGTVTIAIPPGSSSGRKLRIRGKGENGGDWIVTLQIVVPQQLDDESRRLIEAFAERNPLTPR